MSIQDDVLKFLTDDTTDNETGNPGPDDSLLEAGIIDSVKMLELIAFIEKTYGIKVAEEDLFPENFDTLNAIETFINSKK